MNPVQVIFMMIILLSTMVSGVPIPRQDRINYPDLDSRNRVNEHMGSVNILAMHSGGGGWPSTTGNPSGGGRWNN